MDVFKINDDDDDDDDDDEATNQKQLNKNSVSQPSSYHQYVNPFVGWCILTLDLVGATKYC